jgi:type I restriction-modification system DNA methylase subunit
VVRLCVEICDPAEGMSVYDPTVGSGGMLIQMRDFLREKAATPASWRCMARKRSAPPGPSAR